MTTPTLTEPISELSPPVRFPLPDDLQAALDRPADRVTLSDGRTLSYRDSGDPSGTPILWFHGTPSCRMEGVMLDEPGRRFHMRFLALDRPGIGQSDPHPGWSMLDHIHDAVQLADRLGLERFGVMGGSGGGPFVLAAALACPERLTCAVSLACAGAFELPELRAHIGLVDRIAAWSIAHSPLAVRTYFAGLRLGSRLSPTTAHTLGRWMPGMVPGRVPAIAPLGVVLMREMLRQGDAGGAADAAVLHNPWGFELTQIRAPVDFYQGTRDEFIPVAYSTTLASLVPQSRLILCEGDDHFATIYDLDRIVRRSGERFAVLRSDAVERHRWRPV